MANFYEAVRGTTHGMAYHAPGEVFAGDEALDAAYEDTGGKTLDGEVLYKKVSQEAYAKFVNAQEHPLVDGSPRSVVGFEPTGEDSLGDAQVDAEGEALEADKQAGKPEKGDPLAPDSAEAERRLGEKAGSTKSADGVKGGAGPAPSAKE